MHIHVRTHQMVISTTKRNEPFIGHDAYVWSFPRWHVFRPINRESEETTGPRSLKDNKYKIRRRWTRTTFKSNEKRRDRKSDRSVYLYRIICIVYIVYLLPTFIQSISLSLFLSLGVESETEMLIMALNGTDGSSKSL